MKAVVLMAGKGTRWAKHFQGPKQLTPVNGKPILEHLLDALVDNVDSFVFIVGGPHEPAIRNHFSSGEYKGKKIDFVVQTEQLGLAHAFSFAKEFIDGPWFGSVADDIFDPDGIRELLQHDSAVLAYRVPNPENFGVLVTDTEGNLQFAVEKPKEFVSDLVWTGAMVMQKDFFDVQVEPSARGEYETPDVWTKLIKEKGASIKVIEAKMWLPINDKDQLQTAEKYLSSSH